MSAISELTARATRAYENRDSEGLAESLKTLAEAARSGKLSEGEKGELAQFESQAAQWGQSAQSAFEDASNSVGEARARILPSWTDIPRHGMVYLKSFAPTFFSIEPVGELDRLADMAQARLHEAKVVEWGSKSIVATARPSNGALGETVSTWNERLRSAAGKDGLIELLKALGAENASQRQFLETVEKGLDDAKGGLVVGDLTWDMASARRALLGDVKTGVDEVLSQEKLYLEGCNRLYATIAAEWMAPGAENAFKSTHENIERLTNGSLELQKLQANYVTAPDKFRKGAPADGAKNAAVFYAKWLDETLASPAVQALRADAEAAKALDGISRVAKIREIAALKGLPNAEQIKAAKAEMKTQVDQLASLADKLGDRAASLTMENQKLLRAEAKALGVAVEEIPADLIERALSIFK